MKRKLSMLLLLIITVFCTVGIYGCDESNGIINVNGVKTYTYGGYVCQLDYYGGAEKGIGGLVFGSGIDERDPYEDDIKKNYYNVLIPGDYRGEGANRGEGVIYYTQKGNSDSIAYVPSSHLERYGDIITVGKNTMNFNSRTLARYNSAKYSLSGNSVSFLNDDLQAEFKNVTLENGVLRLCSSSVFGIWYNSRLYHTECNLIYEYYSIDYIAPSYKISFDYGEFQDNSWVTEKVVQLNMPIGELPAPQVEGYRLKCWCMPGLTIYPNRSEDIRYYFTAKYGNIIADEDKTNNTVKYFEIMHEDELYIWEQDLTFHAYWEKV